MIFNLVMGVIGLILAGDSFGYGIRNTNPKKIVVGAIELIAGLYFIAAAIGLV